ncbi:MAG: zinc-dependent peptidase [Deltaproteobacteria bacterium]|nr:zinc-dependent peptidase [Deltaproteobacteria bacterium]
MFARRRRNRILAAPFPATWDAIIDENVALARRLAPGPRQRLRDLVHVFVAEKYWEGCGGLELTEEMQVTIAAQSCLLALGRAGDSLFTDVMSILVYPSTVITAPQRLGLFEQPRTPIGHAQAVIGEAMLGGPVVLAWDAVLAGGREDMPGNVVLHELAHKLDMETGRINGTPSLPDRAARDRWAAVCSVAYARHRTAVANGYPTLMDAYGATNEAEFFAVATETYFTRPFHLQYEHPDLCVLLDDYYRFPFA